ncbi:hypothetical protein ACVWYN_003003 [Pedobacter sp. UYP24]
MFQRDYILVELQKFTRMMARLMGLKEAGKLSEFDLEVDSILQQEYDSDLFCVFWVLADNETKGTALPYFRFDFNLPTQLFY